MVEMRFAVEDGCRRRIADCLYMIIVRKTGEVLCARHNHIKRSITHRSNSSFDRLNVFDLCPKPIPRGEMPSRIAAT